ncbi:hypothetical protein K9M79_07560 [Candidatus Woesearchaeota archaeon]|nr:hypothetical protein [Candidatus Woesearchaeota archaeon]
MKIKYYVALMLILVMMPFSNAIISSGYKHSSDYYAVTFDGEGDAIVSAQLNIRNTMSEPLYSITLEFPKRIIIYDVAQESYGRTCKSYTDQTTCEIWDGSICKKYSNSRVCDYYYDYGHSYTRVNASSMEETILSESTGITINLPTAIEPEQSSTLVISYKIDKYAKSFINYNFDFETIIDNNAAVIENVRVSVNVVDGLYMSGVESEVEHRDTFNLAGMQEAVASKSMDSAVYKEYSSVITRASGLVKTSSFLDASESFHVKGSYSKSWWLLNFWKIILFVGLFIAVIWLSMRLIKKAAHKFSERKPAKEIKKTAQKKDISHPIMESVLVGFASAFLTVLSTIVAMVMMEIIDDVFYNMGMLLGPLVLILIIAMDGFLLFVPPVIVGKRHETIHGLFTFGCTIMFLFVFIIIVAFFAAFWGIIY